MRPRVVITGLGPITAFGVGIEPLWAALCEGHSAVRRISTFDPSGFPCQVAAELPADQFEVRSIVPKSYRKATKVMARDIELAVGAAGAAIADAKLLTKGSAGGDDADFKPTIPGDRFGCHIGAGLIAAELNELTGALATSRKPDGSFDLQQWGSKGMENLTPLWLLKYLPNMLACHVTIIHDCRGPSNTITCAEASSMLSIGESMRVIERGAADACLSGGAESKLNPMGLLRQCFAGRMVTFNGNGDPAGAVKPFDRAAAGTVLGEGGGLLVLEDKDRAAERGARVYAELLGYGASQSPQAADEQLPFASDVEGIADAIEAALRDARLEASAIDAIAPLGSGVAAIDAAERAALQRIFGARINSIPLITTIPNVGNCGAGCGAIAVAIAAKALAEQKLPARINTSTAEGLDANATPTRPAELHHVLIVSTSLGGQNAACILRRA